MSVKKKEENFASSMEELMSKQVTKGSKEYFLKWAALRSDSKDPFALYSGGALDRMAAQLKYEVMIKHAKYEYTLLSYCTKLVGAGQFPCINDECVKLAEYFTCNEMSNGVVIDIINR